MLYKSAEDFYNKVATIKRLSREEEKELALKMVNEGDENAQKALVIGYLPVLAAYLKRYTCTPSLDMIYEGVEILETSIATFDFLYDSPSPNVTFVHFLSDKVRRMMTRYIADKASFGRARNNNKA